MLSDLRIPQAVIRAVPVLALSGIVLADQSAPQQGAAGRGAFTPVEAASIVGTVTADNGQPVAGVTVRVMDRIIVRGDPAVRYTIRSTARSGARGEYRVGVLAGDYIVDIPLTQVTMPVSLLPASAGGPPLGIDAARSQRIADSMGPSTYFAGRRIGGFSFQTMGDQGAAPAPAPASANVVQVYQATIFPGVRTTREARVITVRAGETFRADMQLPAVRGARVSGTLRGSPDEVGSMTIRLLPVMDDLELFRDSDFEQALTVTDERGLFTFLGIPPGKYTLKALYVPSLLPGTGPGGRGEPARVGARGGGAPTEAAMAFVRRAETVVDVADADVTGIDVSLTPAIRVTGTIRASDATATPDFSQARIMMYSNRPVTIAPPSPVAVAADGSFTVRLYGPGLYRAQVSGVPGFTTGGTSVNGAASQQWLNVPRDDLASVIVALTAQPPGLGRGAPLGVRTGLPPGAPPPAPNPLNAFLAGRVIDGATNAPVANTTVVLQRSGEAAALRRVVITDESGTFTFGEAVAGLYAVTTTAAGYSPGAFGRLRADGGTSSLGLAPSERASVTIHMWKPGQIFGEVRDARQQIIAGLPLVSIQVTQSGLRRDYVLHSFSITTATGSFAFSSLPPGEYVVCASFSPTTIPDSTHQAFLREQATSGRAGSGLAALLAESGAATPVPASVPVGPLRFLMGSSDLSAAPMPAPISPSGEIRTYRSLCYPTSAGLADATVVHVDAGANRGPINLTLPDVPTVRITGTLRGPAGPIPNLGLRLVRELGPHDYLIGSERLEAAAAISDARGAFSFLGVPAGRYLLRAWTTHVEGQTPPALPPIGRPASRPTGVTLWAEIPITVADSNLLDVAVTLAPTARVTGRVVLEGSGPPPTQLPIALWSRQQFDPPLPSATAAGADGSFTLRGYAPGHYRLPLGSADWRITSATLNGQLVTGHAFNIATADVSGLVLTATDRFTTLTGRVAPVAGMAPVDATVCIFPADYRSWFARDMGPTELRLFRPSGSWTYTATWLPPGDYLAVVYREADGAELTAAFIERLSKVATPVTLRPGERTALDLNIANIR